MGVELVADEYPLVFPPVSYCRGYMLCEILFVPRLANMMTDYFSCGYFKRGYQGKCAMPHVFELDLLGMTGYHRLRRRNPLQRLDAGLFICRDQMRASIMKLGGM